MMNTRVRPPYHGREVNSTSPPGFSQMRYSPLGRNNFRESSFHPTASGSALHRPSESRTQSPIGPLLARSRAEQVLFDLTASGEKVNAGKYRQLPCRTFLATGHCPYKDRCVYLHCPSIRSAFMTKLKTKRKNKEDIVNDAMFWPIMPQSSSTVDNEYSVPRPRCDQYATHDTYLFSMWEHYVDVCKMISLECSLPSLGSFSHGKAKRKLAEMSNSDAVMNNHVNLHRLDIFRQLSKGESFFPEKRRNLSFAENSKNELSISNQFLPVPMTHLNVQPVVMEPLAVAPVAITPPYNKKDKSNSPVSFTEAWKCLSPEGIAPSSISYSVEPNTHNLPAPLFDVAEYEFNHHSEVGNLDFNNQSLFNVAEEEYTCSAVLTTDYAALTQSADASFLSDEHFSNIRRPFISDQPAPVIDEMKQSDVFTFMEHDEPDEDEIFSIFENSKRLLEMETLPLQQNIPMQSTYSELDGFQSVSTKSNSFSTVTPFIEMEKLHTSFCMNANVLAMSETSGASHLGYIYPKPMRYSTP